MVLKHAFVFELNAIGDGFLNSLFDCRFVDTISNVISQPNEGRQIPD